MAAEYFVGTDPGFGSGTAISIENVVSPNDAFSSFTDVPIPNLKPGIHRIGLRFQNSVATGVRQSTGGFF